ncbi:metalloproteinase inhibitor 4-like [Labeo rohita]|uniref:metalloproteinase inhibitor 4-like n=1 Tax=Labeo rohita TaxID=84645 RepID=UPI0021E23A54|nr:metalloproteinase inhibitor 4-like [Labeo rohita]XP_050979004.1 metalloproteinase inhibitor 4-like [Labeo rohita]XP_050979005.1 metalloproteinase inhibitor 4-like [Labeo rohita]
MSAAVTLGLLFFLSVGLNYQVAEGCSCRAPRKFQQLFCMSEIVMRAEVTGEKIIHSNKHRPGMGTIQYEIQVIKVFKGFDSIKKIHHVYTKEQSSMCGTRLGHEQYLLTGNITPKGVFVSMCNYHELWDRLSLVKKRNLKYIFRMGCN